MPISDLCFGSQDGLVADINQIQAQRNSASAPGTAAGAHPKYQWDRPTPENNSDWTAFVQEFNVQEFDDHIEHYSINIEKKKISLLLQCAQKDTARSICHQFCDTLNDQPLAMVLTAMKHMFAPKTSMALRSDLMRIDQQEKERVRLFFNRIKALAVDCDYTARCKHCNGFNDYSDLSKDVLIPHLRHLDLKREAIALRNARDMRTEGLVAWLENHEMAREASMASYRSTMARVPPARTLAANSVSSGYPTPKHGGREKARNSKILKC